MEGVTPTFSPPRRVQTRSGPRKDNADKRSHRDTEDDSSGAAQIAPTAKLQKHKHELELAKIKIACQEDLIKELTKDRDFLKDQLSQTLRNTSTRNDDPSPETSDRKKRKKKNIKKKKGKRSSISRARGPVEVVVRYQRVLKA